MWSKIIIHLSRMNLILNWKMGSSLHFNSSTFLYILCQRQNLIVDSILRFIQYSLYVQWAIGLVELCLKTMKIKIYIDLPLSYLVRNLILKLVCFLLLAIVPAFKCKKMATKKYFFNADIPPKWWITCFSYAFITFGWVYSQFFKIAHFLYWFWAVFLATRTNK